MDNLIEVIIIVFMYSFSKVCTDLRKDTATNNNLYKFCVKLGNFLGRNWVDWYIGGNKKYNSSFIFTADFWHFFEHVKSICISYLFIIALNLTLYKNIIIFILAYFSIGQFFELMYRYILPDNKAGSFFDWLKRAIIFWRNYH